LEISKTLRPKFCLSGKDGCAPIFTLCLTARSITLSIISIEPACAPQEISVDIYHQKILNSKTLSKPLNPRKIVTIKIINPKIFWNLEFTYFPKTTFLFTIHKSIPATTGSKIPLATCANLMISIGLNIL